MWWKCLYPDLDPDTDPRWNQRGFVQLDPLYKNVHRKHTDQEVREGLEPGGEEEGEGEEQSHHQHQGEQNPGQAKAHLNSTQLPMLT